MDDLDSLFTIDRSGEDEKILVVKKTNNKKSKKKEISSILYDCKSEISDNIEEGKTKCLRTKPDISRHLNKRLHEAVTEQKKFVPGVLSDKLRDAMGLSKYGLPLHIYKMRYLGYPPGWLKRAEISPVELKFIGDDTRKNVTNSTDYQIDELIHFPGFNSLINYDPEEDHWKDLGMIPMQEEHKMEEFTKSLQKKAATSKLIAQFSGNNHCLISAKKLQSTTDCPSVTQSKKE